MGLKSYQASLHVLCQKPKPIYCLSTMPYDDGTSICSVDIRNHHSHLIICCIWFKHKSCFLISTRLQSMGVLCIHEYDKLDPFSLNVHEKVYELV